MTHIYAAYKRPTARHIKIKMAKFQDKKRIFKEAREKQEVTYKGAPIGKQMTSQQKSYKPEGKGKKYSKKWKTKAWKQNYATQQGSHIKWKVKQGYSQAINK